MKLSTPIGPTNLMKIVRKLNEIVMTGTNLAN